MPDTPIYIPDGVLANPLDADDVIRVDRSGKTMYTRVEEFASDPAFVDQYAPLARNILQDGVSTGTTASQTAAIKAALDAHPGEAFYFPPGDYRLDTSLVIEQSNSLILAPDARIYAGAAMSVMVDYDPDTPYATDKAITGGHLDGNLNADTVLRIAGVQRFSLQNFTISDGIDCGLQTTSAAGAEVIATNGRIYNTGTTNVACIGIDSQMGDCHFTDIIINGYTTGVKDVNGARLTRVHCWIEGSQVAARFPTSIGFDLTGATNLSGCFADTVRTSYMLRSGAGRARLHNCRSYLGSNVDAVIPTYQPVVFDNTSAVGVFCYSLDVSGRAAAASTFVSGSFSGINIKDPRSAGNVNGVYEFVGGVERGTTSFTPNIFGASVSGSQSYGSRSGTMTVADGQVIYRFTLTVTMGGTVSGNLRIGGLPVPVGAASVSVGSGPVWTAANVTTMVGVLGANGSSAPLVAIPQNVSGSEIAGAATAGLALTIRGQIVCPYVEP